MKLTPRFTLIFIAYATALLIGVGLMAYNSGQDALRAATISELQATALEKEASLDQWIGDKQTDISAIAADLTITRAAYNLLNADQDSQEAESAHNELVSSLEPYLAQGEFLNLSLLDPQSGEVLASTDPGEEGEVKKDRPYYVNGLSGPFVQGPYFSTSLQSIAMTASSPLKTRQGQVLGVLTGRLNLDEMNDIINRRTGLHQTDEAYMINETGQFVTQPRFFKKPALQQGQQTTAVAQCPRQQSGVTESDDYRNVPAFVVYRWLPDRGLCLIVKVDQIEAYRPVRIFGGTIATISALALLAAAALAFALARSLTRPILALQEGAARFGRGELDARLDDSAGDELGQLAGEFNKMALALAEQQTHLRRRAEQFFNLSPDLLCTVNATTRMQDLNPAWELILGYSRDELKSRLLSNFVHPEDWEMTQSALRRIAAEGSGRFENRFRHKRGHYRWLAWVVVNSSQDQLLYAAARDITERQMAEERMRQQTDELERSNRELLEFANVAAHDLQEPLQMVSNHVQLLSRRYRGRLDQDADEFIEFALEGTNRLKSLISDLLAYSRVGKNERRFAPVEMESIFARVMETYQPLLDDCRGSITHDPLPVIQGDDEQMVLLLQNLIDNSIKFRSKEPPRIHIGARQLSERLLLFVRDNGIGIDPQYTGRVFAIFQRLHSRDDYPGTGIGLAICRKIIERHGGHIWVDSEPGKGATFYFTLPPVDGWEPPAIQPEVGEQQKDTIADRATNLI